MTISRLRALMLLNECTGVDIWSVETCRDKGVPEVWLEELADAFESGFKRDEDTIYFEDEIVSQFYGIHDLRLAAKLAEHLGVDVQRATAAALTRRAEVRALKEAADEL